MKVLVLAAGYGTRLKAIAENTPKPLLDIGKRPMIDHILERVMNLKNLDGIYVVTNNKFEKNFQEWKKKTKTKHPITIINDGTNTPEERLGSIGDILFAIQNGPIQDDLLVVGGDNLFDFNLDKYIAFAQTKQHSSLGLYDVGNIEEATKFGVVEINKDGKVVSFEEKPAKPKSSLVAMCFYYFPKNTLNLFAEYLSQTEKSDTAGDYIRWLAQKTDVFGFKFTGTWYDIGSIEAYYEAQQKFV